MKHVALEKAVFVLAALPAPIATVFASQQAHAIRTSEAYGFLPRILQAFYGTWYYLVKTFVPVRLTPLLEVPYEFHVWSLAYWAPVFLCLAITVLLVRLRGKWLAGLWAWLCYLLFLAPTSGLLQRGPQLVADRYSYLACLGWAVLAGAGVRAFLRRWHGYVIVAALLIFGFWSCLTWQQSQVWHDSERLWTYVIGIDAHSTIAHNNLGELFFERRKLDEAAVHYVKSIEANPAYSDPHNGLGNVYHAKGKLNEAFAEYQRALQIGPERSEFHNNMGTVLAAMGRFDDALSSYQRALRLDPENGIIHYNTAILLQSKDRLDEAIAYYQKAIQLKPSLTDAYHNLGVIYAGRGELRKAREAYQGMLRIDPDHALAQKNLALINAALNARRDPA